MREIPYSLENGAGAWVIVESRNKCGSECFERFELWSDKPSGPCMALARKGRHDS